MIVYSKQESNILGIPFGRVIIENNFNEWDNLKKEIDDSFSDFIRIKIKNVDGNKINNILRLAPKAHLLEILRVYKTDNLLEIPYKNEYEDLTRVKVTDDNKDILAQFILDTYEDIPFGTYTPSHLFAKFPVNVQLQNIIEYFCEYYTGQYDDKAAYLFYNQDNKLVGGVVTEHFNDNNGNAGTFPYYMAVARDARKKGIHYKLCSAIKNIALEKGYPFAIGSTRLSNLYSARAFEKCGYNCIQHDWVYLLEK